MDIHNTQHLQVRELFEKHNLRMNVTIMTAVILVVEQTGIPADLLLSRSRKHEVVYARHLLHYVLVMGLDYTPTYIAESLHLDRSSVIASIQRISQWRGIYDHIPIDIQSIFSQIKKNT